ncbi:MAG: diguanylate cyclase [Solirubrobacteraceae bacterium]
MFVLCGVGLTLLAGDQKATQVGRRCAAACLPIALAFLSEYIVGWNLGIDQIPFHDGPGRAAHIAYPGRPGLTTLICFVLICLSLLAPNQRWRLEGVLMTPVVGAAGLSIVGFAYEIPVFYGEASTAKIALNTSIVFLILATGIVFGRTDREVQRMRSTADPGQVMARRLLPLAIVVPLLLGWLQLVGGRHDVYGRPVGAWLLTTSTIACLLVVIALAARSLSRADRHRLGLEAELHRLAGEDELTGLPNRRRFAEDLRRDLALAARHHTPGVLLMIDLDGFKAINDEHGHAAGDALLRTVNDALRHGLRDTDLRGRLSGDEFVAYLARTDQPAATQIAEHLLALIRTTSAALGPGMQTTASIGIATDSSAAADPQAMLAAADIAMYRAKRAGGNRFAVWDPSSHQQMRTPARDPHKTRTPIVSAIDRAH